MNFLTTTNPSFSFLEPGAEKKGSIKGEAPKKGSIKAEAPKKGSVKADAPRKSSKGSKLGSIIEAEVQNLVENIKC